VYFSKETILRCTNLPDDLCEDTLHYYVLRSSTVYTATEDRVQASHRSVSG
jgi:hypothetical protein